MKKYIAYDPMNNEFELFETQQDALSWILDQDWSEGLPPEFSDGHYFVAKITHRSNYKVTDKKEDGKEWPYSDEFDFVGEPQMQEVK